MENKINEIENSKGFLDILEQQKFKFTLKELDVLLTTEN